MCWEWALGSGYHLALVLSTHGGRLAVKQPRDPVAAWLLWEKSPSHLFESYVLNISNLWYLQIIWGTLYMSGNEADEHGT